MTDLSSNRARLLEEVRKAALARDEAALNYGVLLLAHDLLCRIEELQADQSQRHIGTVEFPIDLPNTTFKGFETAMANLSDEDGDAFIEARLERLKGVLGDGVQVVGSLTKEGTYQRIVRVSL